ncbi:MAG: TolC family protein, partial [Desulfomonile tiedjei]|nr:TolC family protein [Desulfomonile tiedjei]
ISFILIQPLVTRAAAVNGKKPVHHSARLSLAQAVSIALSRNLRMADSRLAVTEKEHQRREAFSDFFPSIDTSYTASTSKYQQSSYIDTLEGIHPSRWTIRGNSSNPTLAPNYPYRIDPYRQFTLNATLTQPLFTGGKYLNDYKYAKLGVDYYAIQFQVDRQDLILDVNKAYFNLIQAIKLLGVANDSIRALQALRNQSTEFYKAGLVAKVDVLSSEGQLAQAYIQQTEELRDIGEYKATLCNLLRYPQETPLEVIDDLTYQPNSYRIPEIYATAAANRLEIRQANISVDQAMAIVKSAKAELLPQASGQITGKRVNDDWNVFDPEGNNDWGVTGTVTWSFDMYRTRSVVNEKRASHARAFVAREQLVEEIMEEVKLAYLDMKRSESDIQNNRKAVDYRRENFRINQDRYKKQIATYIEVLDAQKQLSSAEGDYITAMIGYMTNRAVLERKMGTLR